MATSPGMARWCREVSHRAEGRWAIQLSIGSSARLPSLSAHAADMPRTPARHRDTLKHTHTVRSHFQHVHSDRLRCRMSRRFWTSRTHSLDVHYCWRSLVLAPEWRLDQTGTEDEREEAEAVEGKEERAGCADYRREAVKEPVVPHPASSLRGAIAAHEKCTTGQMVGLAQLLHRHSPGARGQRAQPILYFGDGGRVSKTKLSIMAGASGFRCSRCSASRRVRAPVVRRCLSGEGTAPAGRSADKGRIPSS